MSDHFHRRYVSDMFFVVLRLSSLIFLALLAVTSAAVMAYGTDPFWGQYHKGLSLILFAHRLQWLLTILTLVGSLGLVAMVIAGKTRTWWLIALGPVLALFVHRFAANPMQHFRIAEEVETTRAREVTGIKDEDMVVGLTFEHQQYAFPYAGLFETPVIVQARHDQRFILMWSPYANRAVAYGVDNQFKVRDLQLVSMPADALLLYNRKLGQFINGLKGQGLAGEKPVGFLQPVETQKTTWGNWKSQHPGTVAMATSGTAVPPTALAAKYPTPQNRAESSPGTTAIIFVPATRPVALAAASVESEPVSISAGETQLMLFRDANTGRVRAYDRRVKDDLFPILQRKIDPKHPEVAFIDRDSGSGWTLEGKAVEGPLKGEQLRRVQVDEGVYWGVMKYWYPELQWVEAIKAPTLAPIFTNPADPKPGHRTRRSGTAASGGSARP